MRRGNHFATFPTPFLGNRAFASRGPTAWQENWAGPPRGAAPVSSQGQVAWWLLPQRAWEAAVTLVTQSWRPRRPASGREGTTVLAAGGGEVEDGRGAVIKALTAEKGRQLMTGMCPEIREAG